MIDSSEIVDVPLSEKSVDKSVATDIIKQRDQDLGSLLLLFPHWKKDVIDRLFEDNNYSLDVTIQSILTIEGVNENRKQESDKRCAYFYHQLAEFYIFLRSVSLQALSLHPPCPQMMRTLLQPNDGARAQHYLLISCT